MSTLAHWQHHATANESHLVLPDGCVDLICSVDPDGMPTWFVSHLANRAYEVDIATGETSQGLRFTVGAQVNTEALLGSIGKYSDMDDIKKNVAEFVVTNANVDDALAVLREEKSVAKTAQVLGVSARSLQRLLVTHTQQPPSFWLRLGRVRHCAQTLVNARHLSLAQLAYDMGYTDQAHMTHEFKHWFGMTPQQFYGRADMLEAINASGYGTY